MASSIIAMGKMPSLPALKRQRLLAEFAALKQASPPGVFVSLTPGDPSLWSGVIFVRHGPYATAVLRFQISFPDAYPSLPPLVTFATDMFHPLITPLTTYMYTTDVQEGGTVSATDDERLPPGGFSLRHGFPGWFGRGRNNRTREREREREREGTPPPLPPRRGSGIVTAIATATATGSGAMTPPPVPHISSIQEVQSNTGTGGGVVAVGSITGATPGSVTSSATAVTAATTTGAVASGFKRTRREVSTYEVLGYIRSTFDDSDVLDSIPLEAAGNPGAWHAWRAHRRALERKTSPPPVSGMESGTTTTAVPSEAGSVVTSPTVSTEKLLPATPRVATPTARRPEEWNWEGVWQERVKRGIATSLSEAVLFGGAGMADDVINFLNMDETEVDETKKKPTPDSWSRGLNK